MNRQAIAGNVDTHDKNTDKTYVWVKLTGGKFALSSSQSTINRTKTRGAPTPNGHSSDVWEWAPGYYCCIPPISPTEGGDATEAADAIDHCLVLFGKPNSDGEPQQESRHKLPKSSVTKLLELGDIVLANQWEVHDFIHNLSLGGGGDEDDSEPGYGDDDSDSGDDGGGGLGGQTGSFLDAPNVSPPSNLIELTHLHEPSVVHALRYRYDNASGVDMNNVYTDTGPILLAVNPFKRDESGMLYGEETVGNYRRAGEARWLENLDSEGNSKRRATAEAPLPTGKSLPPHVYGVADRAFRLMMTCLHPPLDISEANSPKSKEQPQASLPQKKSNQSILVSGESGAGKTWTTKLLMSYLSKLSENIITNNSSSDADENCKMSIKRRILESNPIMESFGNARTIRNDNSSRFGKYIEMNFESSSGHATLTPNAIPGAMLVGASIETYLLEKVRLVHQAPGERNYHIFYQLFSIKDDDGDKAEAGEEKATVNWQCNIVEKIGLLDYDMEDFRLLNTSSDTYDRRDGVTDDETFRDMKSAMSIMGFSLKDIMAIFEVTTALLHAGNLIFESIGDMGCRLVMENPHLEYVAYLLGIKKERLNQALCYHEITVGGHGLKGCETHQKHLSQEQAEKGVEALIKAIYGAIFDHLVNKINDSVAGDVRENTIRQKEKRGDKASSVGILDIFGFESFQTNSFEQLCINYCNEALQQQFNRFVLRNEQEEYDREGIPWNFIEFPDNQDVLDLISFKGTGILNILHDQCRTPGASDENFARSIYSKCTTNERFEADARQVGELLFGIHHYAGLVEYNVEGFVEKTRDDLPKSGSDLLLSSSNNLVKTVAAILQPSLLSSGAKSRKLMSPRTGGSGQRPTLGIQFSSQLQTLRSKIDDTSPHYIRCMKPNHLLVPNNFDTALVADQLRCAGVIEAVRVSRLGYPQRFVHSQFCERYRILGKISNKKKNAKKYNTAKALVHSIGQQISEETDDLGIQCGKTKVFLRRKAYDLLERLRQEMIASAAIAIQKNGRKLVCQMLYAKALRATLTVQCFVRTLLAIKNVSERRQQHNSTILQAAWRQSRARVLFFSARVIAHFCQTHQRGSIGRKRYTELNRDVKAKYIQSQWRGYWTLKTFQICIKAVLIIQCARRCYASRVLLSKRKSEARNLSNVVQERDKLRQEARALRNEIQQMNKASKAKQAQLSEDVNCDISIKEKDNEIESLRHALEQLTKEKESADHELKNVSEMFNALRLEKDKAVGDLDDIKQINIRLQNKSKSSEEELSLQMEKMLSVKKELEEMKESTVNVDETDSKRRHARTAELKNESQKHKEGAVFANADAKQITFEELSSSAVDPSMCTITTADIDVVNEGEMAKLREENQVLRKQLDLLRVTNGFECIPDEDHDDSLIPDSKSDVTEYMGEAEANAVPDSVMKQILSEVEIVTEEVIIKTRAESEAKIAELNAEIESLKVERERSKKHAKYDLDDMTRVNRSLRQEIETINEEKYAIEEELEAKCDEFDALNEDVERFAETFAEQHSECQQLEGQVRNLLLENEKLTTDIADKKERIEELEVKLEAKQEVGSELGKLWEEVERLKTSSIASPPIKQVNDPHFSLNSTASDISR